MDSEQRQAAPQQPNAALFFKAQSEAQTLTNLKATILSVMLMDQPTVSFTTEALNLTQKLFQHLAGPLIQSTKEPSNELPD